MSIESALAKKTPTLTPEKTVGEAITLLEKKKLRNAPVLNKDGTLAGFFSIRHLMKNLLPVSVQVDSGLQMAIPVSMAPGMDKRLASLKDEPVSALMERKMKTIALDTPVWEAVSLLIEERRPLPVLEEGSQKFLGVVTEQSLLQSLENDEEK